MRLISYSFYYLCSVVLTDICLECLVLKYVLKSKVSLWSIFKFYLLCSWGALPSTWIYIHVFQLGSKLLAFIMLSAWVFWSGQSIIVVLLYFSIYVYFSLYIASLFSASYITILSIFTFMFLVVFTSFNLEKSSTHCSFALSTRWNSSSYYVQTVFRTWYKSASMSYGPRQMIVFMFSFSWFPSC